MGRNYKSTSSKDLRNRSKSAEKRRGSSSSRRHRKYVYEMDSLEDDSSIMSSEDLSSLASYMSTDSEDYHHRRHKKPQKKSKSKSGKKHHSRGRSVSTSSSSSSEPDTSSVTTATTTSTSDSSSSSSSSSSDSEYDRRRRGGKSSKNKKKKGKKGGGGCGGFFGFVLFVGIIGALGYGTVQNLQPVLKLFRFSKFNTGGDPDSILANPLPVPARRSLEYKPMEWKPLEDRMVQESMANPGATYDKQGVVLPLFETTVKVLEELVAVGSPAIDEAGNSIIAGKKLLSEEEQQKSRLNDGYFRLVSVNQRNGFQNWELNLQEVFPSQLRKPLVVGDVVIFPATCKSIDGFHTKDGSPAWSFQMPVHDGNACNLVELAVEPKSGIVIGITADGLLVAFDSKTGVVRAPTRRIQCSHAADGSCVTSFVNFDSATSTMYVMSVPSEKMIKSADVPSSSSGSSSWFGGRKDGGGDIAEGLTAVYKIQLVDADADQGDEYMFRVVKTRILPAVDIARDTRSETVAIAPDGSVVAAASGCMVFGLSPIDLSEVWKDPINIGDLEKDYDLCSVTGIVFSEDSDFFVASRTRLYHIQRTEEGDANVMWTLEFSKMYENLHPTEEVRVLSTPIVRDNGVLLRIGTSRGKSRTIVQAGVVLIDRETGAARYFAPSTHISTSDLTVDRFGQIFSAGDITGFYAKQLFGPNLIQSPPGGLQILGLTPSNGQIAMMEAVRCAVNRAENAKRSIGGSGWFGSKRANLLASIHDIAHARELWNQALHLAETLNLETSHSSLRTTYSGYLADSSLEDFARNIGHYADIIISHGSAILQ